MTKNKILCLSVLLLSCVMGLHSKTQTTPRKQLIDDSWLFHLGDIGNVESLNPKDCSSWQRVSLPHDWSVLSPIAKDNPSGNDGGYYPTGIGWYMKTINLAPEMLNKRLWLYFEGVYQDSEVYVNGKLVGGHPYGYSSFFCDITRHVGKGNNTVLVKADNSRQKNCRWYSGSGIYRHVWLLATDPVHVDMWGVHITTPDLRTVRVATTVRNETDNDQEVVVTTTLSDGTTGKQTVAVSPKETKEVVQTLNVAQPRLWSPDSPNLYTAHISLSTGDEVEETFGIRTIEYSAESGLLLNGKPLLLNGGCVHHDNGILGAAAYDKAEIRRAELLKRAGYNAMRTSHNPTSEAFLNACDRLGLLVIDEAFDGWREKKNDEDYHVLFDKWYEADIEAMVRRDRNHPSIFCWSVGNEVIERKKIEVVTTARKLRDAVRKWDTSRPVTSALAAWDSDWEIYDPLAAEMDITGYNYMIHKAESDHERNPERVMIQTESYPRDAFKNWKTSVDHPYVIGDFVWTAIDYLGESGIGRWWYDGDVPGEHYHRDLYPWHAAYCGDIDLVGILKPIGHYRNMLWNGNEKLYMAVREPDDWQGNGKINLGLWAAWPTWESWNWEGWEGRDIDVVVCSRYDAVRLYLNDKLIGEQSISVDTEFKAIFTVPYQPGKLRAEGISNGVVCESVDLTTATAPHSIRMTTVDSHIAADNQDLAFITLEIVDQNGNFCPNAACPVILDIKGPGEIVAVGNADIRDTTPFTSRNWNTWKGRLLVVVRSNKPGRITLSAMSDGIARKEILIYSNNKK